MAQQSTAIHTFCVYSAAPDAESFEIASIDDLREILAELDRIPADSWDYNTTHDDLVLLRDIVIPTAEKGVTVLVAHDDDGYYFARRSEPSQELAVVVPARDDDPYCLDHGGVRHAHLTDAGEWWIHCPNCGAEHILTEAVLPCSEYRQHANLRGLDGTPFCVCGFERRQHN